MIPARVIGIVLCLALSPVYHLRGQGQFRPLYLSGNVTLEDGSVPPDPARLELVCSGRIEPQALTKPDGSFSFRVGGDQSLEVTSGSADRSQPSTQVGTSGPSASGGTGSGDGIRGLYANPSFVNMSDCEVRAALAGYRSTTVKLGRRSVFESPDIGSLVLIPLAEGEEPPRDPLVSVTTLKAPKKAVKAFEKGQEQLYKEKPNLKKATKELEKAVAEYPEFAAAWNLLGSTRLQTADVEGARLALQKAIETDPGFATPYVTLSILELEGGNLEASIAATQRALEIMPNMAEALFYQGMAYAKTGDMENAKSSLEAVAEGPEEANFPRCHYLLGVIYAETGDLRKSVENCRRFLELEPDSEAAATVRRQIDSWKASGLIE